MDGRSAVRGPARAQDRDSCTASLDCCGLVLEISCAEGCLSSLTVWAASVAVLLDPFHRLLRRFLQVLGRFLGHPGELIDDGLRLLLELLVSACCSGSLAGNSDPPSSRPAPKAISPAAIGLPRLFFRLTVIGGVSVLRRRPVAIPPSGLLALCRAAS